MYPLLLIVHSLLRWVVLAAGVIAFVRSAAGAGGRRAWTPSDDRAGFWFTIALDVQFLIGMALYAWLSPITTAAFDDFGAAMGSAVLRFWAVEHVFGMLIAIVLVHIGRVRIRKADPRRRHKLAAIFFGIALLAILATIPWPGHPAGRPLFRFF